MYFKKTVAETLLNPDVKNVQVVALHIKQSPRFKPGVNSMTLKVASKGQNVGFDCDAEGIPKPKISWQIEGKATSKAINLY